MSGPPLQPIIIKKVKGGGHGGHHGGAWKVAYADFTTAMMSFFLLLWLLNVTTSDQRQGIADYFAPASISDSNSGAGGAMGGKTITSEGAQVANGTPPTQDEETVPTAGKGAEGDEDTAGKSEAKTAAGGEKGSAQKGDAKAAGTKQSGDMAAGKQDDGEKSAGQGAGLGGGNVSKEVKDIAEAMKREEEHFKSAEDLLKKAIQSSPELRDFSQNILVDRTNEGLRIQIVDQEKYSMFSSGSSILYEKSRDLLRMVGRVISRLPNHISVTGHTDSSPFVIGSRRDNWTLSTERANTSRAELVQSGVSEERIEKVVGLSDRDPLVPNNAKDPKNRRISIVLLRQSMAPAETVTPAQSVVEPVTSKPPVQKESGGKR